VTLPRGDDAAHRDDSSILRERFRNHALLKCTIHAKTKTLDLQHSHANASRPRTLGGQRRTEALQRAAASRNSRSRCAPR
jgi:hypothetical protein